MTAFSLSAIYCEGSRDLLDKVRVVQLDTLSLTQGGFTSGSTTSQSSCEAVRLSCNALLERLMPLKTRLEEKSGSFSWETLILQARKEAVHLSVTSYYVPGASSMNYLNYGAAVSEVEIDLLTGETTVLQTDIVYDCGQSLNLAVDLGQTEGAFVMGLGFFMHEEYVLYLNSSMLKCLTTSVTSMVLSLQRVRTNPSFEKCINKDCSELCVMKRMEVEEVYFKYTFL